MSEMILEREVASKERQAERFDRIKSREPEARSRVQRHYLLILQ